MAEPLPVPAVPRFLSAACPRPPWATCMSAPWSRPESLPFRTWAARSRSAAGAITSAAIASVTPQTTTVEGHFLDVTFIDKAKLPIGGIGYEIQYPDNTKSNGVLGGQIKRTGVPQGTYQIAFRGILNAQWSVKQANVGSSVDLIVDTIGIDNGVKATLAVFIRDGNYADHVLTSIDATLSNNQIRVP
jgi:hypothetical protein